MEVILTIITMLSTPILNSIFGDGSLEVSKGAKNPNCIKFVLNQGEDTEDWANYDAAAEEEEVIIVS